MGPRPPTTSSPRPPRPNRPHPPNQIRDTPLGAPPYGGRAVTHPYLSLEYPLRLAHRGSRELWPENTMASFQGAADLGYRYIETDVRITLDNVVVAFHDETLERITNGAGRVRDWRYEELQRLDAAYHFDENGGYPLRGSGIGISTFEEVLLTWPDVHFNVDIKSPRMEWHVAQVVKSTRRENSILVAGFSDLRIARYRRIMGPETATSAGPLGALAMFAASRFGATVASRAAAYQLPFDARGAPIDRKLVDSIHKVGAQLHAWTVNRRNDMDRLLDLGVDGIVTDRPDILNEAVAARAGPSPGV